MSTNVIPTIARPIILELDGVLAQATSGSIFDIGGVVGPNFTVAGQSVLLANGNPAGGGPSPINLQNAYNNSPLSTTDTGKTILQLQAGKDLKIVGAFGDFFFDINSEDGAVTINGSLTVTGTTTQIDTVIQDSDHWVVSPQSGTTTAISIRPDPGVIPVVDLLSIRRTFADAPVFRIDSNGNIVSTKDLNILGLINGVDIVSINTTLQQHVSGTGFRHPASDIDIAPIANIPAATNVQEAFESLSFLANVNAGNCVGYQHIQDTPSQTWMILHNRGTLRASVTVYDNSYEQIIPEQIHIIDANTIRVSFNTPIGGSAVALLF